MKPSPRLIPRLNVEFGVDDLFHALHRDDATGKLSDSVHRWWPGYGPLFVDSGRTALFLSLRAFGLGRGDRVGVPLYTCEAVFRAIAKAGCTPVFLDIDPRTYTLDPAAVRTKTNDLDAVIPIRVFGQPADVESLRIGDRQVRVIEDCAHALGTQVSGQMAGSKGDASFFSFRLGKVVSAGSTGMLLVRDRTIFESAREMWAGLPRAGSFAITADALSSFGRAALYRRPWFGLFALPVGSVVDARLDLMEKFGFDPQQANPGALRVLARRLQDLESRIKAARRNASVFRTATESAGLEPPFEAPWGQHSYFQFAIRFSTASARDRAMADLAARGVDSIRFYHDSAGLAARRYGYEPGTCPTAEAIAQTVLTVPCHGRLTSDDVETIASALENLGDKP